MNIDALAPDTQLTLCLKAEEVCLKRIREIERQSDPGDQALHSLLREIEAWERDQLDQVAGMGSPAAIQVRAEPYFPSARERLGEAPLSRDSAMYYLESLKEEASRFFQKMAQSAMDDHARALFTRIAQGGIGQVARLRTVIL